MSLIFMNMSISAFTILKTKLPSLFQNLTENSRAVASNPRHYSDDDKKLIASEVGHLQNEGIIEPSTSQGRSQAVVTKNECTKRHLVIDYCETTDLQSTITKYKYFSTIDLKSAYHQIYILRVQINVS